MSEFEKRTVQIPNARPDIDGGHSAAKNALSPDGKYVLRALNGFPTKLRLTSEDESCTVILTLAQTATGSPGVLTVRVDT